MFMHVVMSYGDTSPIEELITRVSVLFPNSLLVISFKIAS